jgi:hypothetical protein
MSLILNHIIVQNGLNNGFIIAAADRRITKEGKFDSIRKKIFEIPYLNATVSYFGLAQIYKSNKLIYFSEWLPDFINKQSIISHNIKDFSNNLHLALNNIANKKLLAKYESGFHISGFHNGYPDFWYFSNIGSMNKYEYRDIKNSYFPPCSHFLDRDIKDKVIDEKMIYNFTYRNGDIRTHCIINDDFNSFMEEIFKLPDVNKPKAHIEYVKLIKFKFEFISYLCKNWFKTINISRPIDIYLITKDKIVKY